jgi:hypothetical protein
MSQEIQTGTAVELYCAYLGVNQGGPDPYKVAVGALVLRSTIGRYVRSPKARGFEALLFKAVGAFPNGKNMVEKAAALARRAQIEQASGNLSPRLLEFLEKIQRHQIRNMSQTVFGSFCEEAHLVIEAIRITLPLPLLPNTVKAIEHVLKASFPVLVERNRTCNSVVLRATDSQADDRVLRMRTAVPGNPSSGVGETTETDDGDSVTESDSVSDPETGSGSESESASEQEHDIAYEMDIETDADIPDDTITHIQCRKISLEEAEQLWSLVEDDEEGYLGSSGEEGDTNEEELGFVCLWRAQAANNAWQLGSPLPRKSKQPVTSWTQDDHATVASALTTIGFNAVIFSEEGHTVAATFGEQCSLPASSSMRCFRFLCKWRGDANSRLPKPTAKRGFNKELAEEVNPGVMHLVSCFAPYVLCVSHLYSICVQPEGVVHFGVGIPAGGNTKKGKKAKLQEVLEWKRCAKQTVSKLMRWEELTITERIVEYVAKCNRAASPSDYRMKRR